MEKGIDLILYTVGVSLIHQVECSIAALETVKATSAFRTLSCPMTEPFCGCRATAWKPRPKALSEQPHSVPGLFDALETGGPNVATITAQANGYSAEVERTFFI